MKITKSRNSKWLARASSLLALVGVSGVVASLFSPSRNHGVIDVVAVASASMAYTYLVASMWLSKPPKWLTDWFGGREGRRPAWPAHPDNTCSYCGGVWVGFSAVRTIGSFFWGWGLGSSCIVDTLTVVIYLAGTIQFLTAAKLLVTLTSLHGAYLLTVSAIGFFALIRYIMPGTSRQV